jgi:hypothetical protein
MFAVNDDANGINTVDFGTAELPAYENYFEDYKTKKMVFGSIGIDSSVFDICDQKFSTNQSFIR